MKYKMIALLLSMQSVGFIFAKETINEKKEEFKGPKIVNISPHIPMAGVSRLTPEQHKQNLMMLEQINSALEELQNSTDQSTKADKDQESLLKERQAYLSCIANSYSEYKKLEQRCKK